jgi:hypothetical protein
MVGALVIWALALYGATVIISQSVGRIKHRHQQHPHPLTIVLIVQNAEHQIEGTLRALMIKTAFSPRERRVLVFDVASQDETGSIVQRMTQQHHCLDYVHVSDEIDFIDQLKNVCLNSPRVGCIYDLRDHGMLRDVTHDVGWLLN